MITSPPLHYMLPPTNGEDRGPALCGGSGTSVLFWRNVTCPSCSVCMHAHTATRKEHPMHTSSRIIETRPARTSTKGRPHGAHYLVSFLYPPLLSARGVGLTSSQSPTNARTYSDDSELQSSLDLLRSMGYAPRVVELSVHWTCDEHASGSTVVELVERHGEQLLVLLLCDEHAAAERIAAAALGTEIVSERTLS